MSPNIHLFCWFCVSSSCLLPFPFRRRQQQHSVYWALDVFFLLFQCSFVEVPDTESFTVLNPNLSTLSASPSPPADRLVSVHGAAAHRDWSSVYISGEDQSLYKGRNIDWRGEGGGLCDTRCTSSHGLGDCLESRHLMQTSMNLGQLVCPDVCASVMCVWLYMCDKQRSREEIETQCEVFTHSRAHDRACFTQQPSNCRDTNGNFTVQSQGKEWLMQWKSLQIS